VFGLLADGRQLIARFDFTGCNQAADGFSDLEIQKRFRLPQLTPPGCSLCDTQIVILAAWFVQKQ
jgi:hypothetical protein